jgi:hypothetical protein
MTKRFPHRRPDGVGTLPPRKLNMKTTNNITLPAIAFGLAVFRQIAQDQL